jgi:putative transcriptional regulator
MKKEIPFNEAELVSSLKEALAHTRSQITLRTAKVPAKRTTMKAVEIVKLRRKLRASTPVFAAYLNVSPDTVRGWEKNRRRPSGPALRLLEIAARQPHVLVG